MAQLHGCINRYASTLQAISHQADHHATQSNAESNCTADVADLPGSFAEQSDPVNPFTLFGNTRYCTAAWTGLYVQTAALHITGSGL